MSLDMNRRQFLITTALVPVALLAACGTSKPPPNSRPT